MKCYRYPWRSERAYWYCSRYGPHDSFGCGTQPRFQERIGRKLTNINMRHSSYCLHGLRAWINSTAQIIATSMKEHVVIILFGTVACSTTPRGKYNAFCYQTCVIGSKNSDLMASGNFKQNIFYSWTRSQSDELPDSTVLRQWSTITMVLARHAWATKSILVVKSITRPCSI